MFDSDKVWRCECGNGHFVSITRFDWKAWPNGDVDESLTWFNIDGRFEAPNWRNRVKRLWSMLRNGRADSWVGVELNRQTMIEIRDEIDRLLTREVEQASEHSANQ